MRGTVAVVMLLCTCEIALAQGDSAPRPMAKDADPDWEAVTVRASDPDSREIGYRVSGRQIELRRQTVAAMLMVGYGIHMKQIADAPKWVESAEWEVKGVPDVPGDPDARQIRSLVQKLLAERFGLKMHTQQREMAVFALTVAKGGAKLKPSQGDANGLPDENDRENGGESTVVFTNAPLSLLVTVLDFRMDRPVVDHTGLPGRYDMLLRYTADESRAPADGNAAPGLFTAMEEQLGLKLEPMRSEADAMVIDKVERPREN
jgi:uncharacterized protein (TIGR03435 family)